MMKNIVIVGAGPIGLFLAIRLTQIKAQYGLRLDITVVDPRADNYERPGIVAQKALELLSELIGRPVQVAREGDDTGTSMFIQDLEKSLYRIAKEMGIRIIQSKFEDIEPGAKSIRVSPSEMPEDTIPCDLLLDCSGPRREVVTKLNAALGNPSPFTVKPVSDNPIKNHFIAYINIDADQAHLLSEKRNKDPLKYALALEKLRHRFGWTEFAEPELSLRKYTHTDGSGKIRFYLYYETPPGMTEASQEKREEWLKALLELKTENTDIPFEIEVGKLKFTPYIVDPRKVEPAMWEGGETHPTVVPCGDAQIEPDYRLGIGIISGLTRADALLGSIQISKGEIFINPKKYEAALALPLGKHESELVKDYSIKTESLNTTTLTAAKDIYLRALASSKDIEEKAILSHGSDEIDQRMQHHLFQEATTEFAKTADLQGKILLDKYGNIKDEIALKRYHDKLKDLASKPPSTKDHGTTLALINLAKSYKDLAGTVLTKHHKPVDAKKYYEIAIAILKDYPSPNNTMELAKIHSNLALIAKKRNEFDAAIERGDMALALLSQLGESSSEFAFKVKFNQAGTMIEKAAAIHAKDPEAAARLIELSKKFITNATSNTSLTSGHAKLLRELEEKASLIKEKMASSTTTMNYKKLGN